VPFDVVQDQNRSTIEVELLERRPRQVERLTGDHSFGRRRGSVGVIARFVEHFATVARQAAIVGSHAIGESKEPGSNRARRVVPVEPLVDLNEDVVSEFVEISRGHAQTP
jgi:hypothetical protein